MKLKVKLTKIESTHNNLRTNDMIGEMICLPEVGRGIVVLNDQPLDPTVGDHRKIETSPVTEILEKSDNMYKFKTLNSIYRLDILDILEGSEQ